MASIGAGLAGGVIATIVMIVGMVFWMRMIIGVDPDRGMRMQFGTAHVVYGVVLGAYLGAGILA